MRSTTKLFAFLALFTGSSSMLQATTLYVDGAMTDNSGLGTSWATAKKDVQQAINAAVAGDEVWVKAGIYLPTMDPNGSTVASRDWSFYITAADIKLYGGFAGTESNANQRNAVANPTILSGDLDGAGGTNDSYHVLLAVSRSSACVIDGFTVRGGRGNITTNFSIVSPSVSIIRNNGGGIYNYSSSTTVTNCTFTGNVARYGGGMYNSGSTATVTGCNISNNSNTGTAPQGAGIYNGGNVTLTNCIVSGNVSAGGGGGIYNVGTTSLTNCIIAGNTAVSNGGGMTNLGGTSTIINSVFNNNSSAGANGGGGIYNSSSNTVCTATGCTFYNNRATYLNSSGGGLFFNYNTGGAITNCILFGNTAAAGGNKAELWKTDAVGVLTLSYSIVSDYSGSFYTLGSGISTADPGYVNTANPIGADGIWGTADDGLRISCSSAAKDAGNPASTTPATDIMGNTRTSVFDLGAYEATSTAANDPIPTVTTAVNNTQTAGPGNYSGCAAQVMAIDATSPKTLTGPVVAQVFVQSTAPTYSGHAYVRRYYDIAPSNSTNTATAAVTLYFTQADFDDYNASNSTDPDLPTGPADSTGVANLKISQQHGSSTTGLPGSYVYTGAGATQVLIDPADASIIWNGTANRWEVTFDVTGFSGFFAFGNISGAPLPLKLVDFSAASAGTRNVINWQSVTETEGSSYEIERSGNGNSFIAIGEQKRRATAGSYRFYDEQPLSPVSYYRLKIKEDNGLPGYSSVAIVRRDEKGGSVMVSPVPASSILTIISTDASLNGQSALICNMQGQVMRTFTISSVMKIDISSLVAGNYILRLPTGEVMRIVKQ